MLRILAIAHYLRVSELRSVSVMWSEEKHGVHKFSWVEWAAADPHYIGFTFSIDEAQIMKTFLLNSVLVDLINHVR